MNTPPGLLGSALLFWGWQTGLLLVAVPVALGLEASRLVAWRWDLSHADVRRMADLGRLILVAMAVYLGATQGTARIVLGLVAWFPLAVLPLVVCQAYGAADRVELRTFFLILRRRGAGDGEVVNLSYPHLVLCIAAASAANVRTPTFYAGLCVLAAWALWPVRFRAFAGPVWMGTLVLAAAGGFMGHIGLRALQGVIERTVAEWAFEYRSREPDPFRSQTAIGSIGQLKLSNRILLRVDTGGPREVPLLLHEASYNLYSASVWGAEDAEFESVPAQPDRRTWDLLPAARADQDVTIAAYLTQGRGVVALPNGASRIEELLALRMSRNRLGAVKVEEGLGLIAYRVRFASDVSLGGPPNETDLKIPKREAPIIGRIAAELGLAGKSPHDALAAVRRYFGTHFRYSTYLDAPARGSTALEDFFLQTRAGHCEYFATATAMLLRAAGVPARYATGYSVQEWSPRERRYLVRSRHAHSWALVYVDGTWRDFDTTPPVWLSVEREHASRWEPLYDLGSWAMFLFSRWRRGDQDTSVMRYVGWLLAPLVGLLVWRLYARRRITRTALDVAASPHTARPGADSEFYLIERRLGELGLGRRSWEPVLSWLDRVRTMRLADVITDPLPAMAILHYRYRFDPEGLTPAERETLRAGVRSWLDRHPTERSTVRGAPWERSWVYPRPMGSAGGAGAPLYALAVTPGLRWVFDRAYRAFADRRLRISHACGLAARHPFLTAAWRHLVMLSYEVDPGLLAPLVPAGTTLDPWEGRALVSVVGFRFLDTRVLGVPIPGHRDFDEVNLRFYVRREVGGEVRRGVVFIRELVPRAAVTWLARRAYNEPYRTVAMRSTAPRGPSEAPGRLVYEWRTEAGWQRVAATGEGAPAVPPPGSHEEFITRHHWGYTRQPDGGTIEYEVEHPAWRVWRAAAPTLEADVAGLYGAAFVPALSGPPVSALIADGSAVTVYRPRRVVDSSPAAVATATLGGQPT